MHEILHVYIQKQWKHRETKSKNKFLCTCTLQLSVKFQLYWDYVPCLQRLPYLILFMRLAFLFIRWVTPKKSKIWETNTFDHKFTGDLRLLMKWNKCYKFFLNHEHDFEQYNI